ncbi:GTP-binding protein At3g49725, chloroplastic isoform X1 [Amborella trichopoda]|uniref:Hflx-type G domain-containing protein n=1 Tax=Amborella trichopoda TaxID=13333 RepID=W1NFG2_AMBTC|nr:GTP-binding protein At3g49725, chloroplastic isoform X1 [Amborella trichopoda]ERM93915.1 hypothetical protein AMTR_s00137p00063430 [Amborella trichopoda]|eukprot:XP_020518451.1 GTP-binding protein At3g49725, chloroplastic isoform X1 [Amborella trichopoda]
MFRCRSALRPTLSSMLHCKISSSKTLILQNPTSQSINSHFFIKPRTPSFKSSSLPETLVSSPEFPFCKALILPNPYLQSRSTHFIRSSGIPPFCAFSLSSTLTSHRGSHYGQSSPEIDDDDANERFIIHRDLTKAPRLFVVQPRIRPDSLLQSKLSEALNLANSLEEQREGVLYNEPSSKEMPPHLVVQNPVARSLKTHADTYFGAGTVDNIKCHLNALDSKEEVDAIFVNAILSGIQQRNLERDWGKPVLDRVGLIIEIFNAHAQTKEAKLQSELASLMYKKSRLVRVRGSDGRLTFGASGEAEVVSARGRGSGGQGFMSGAGETELQLQRRRILERRNRLLSRIEDVRRTRALQRAARKRRGGLQGQGLPTVAVVGYTNAGKSTLVSALSNTDLYSDDRLFATVDPRLRSVILPSGKKVLLSDTVGFISDLPVQLVEAFHATLEEVVEADLLVHVLDSSAMNLEEQRAAVLQVLQQIGVPEVKLQNMIEVWNKIDLLHEKSGSNDCEDQGEDEGDGEVVEEQEEQHDEVSELMDCHYAKLQEDEGEQPDNEASELASHATTDSDEAKSEEDDKVGSFSEEAQVEPKNIQHIEASAVMGLGLQELLKLIDQKLNMQSSTASSSSCSFTEGCVDRKWRPPFNREVSVGG